MVCFCLPPKIAKGLAVPGGLAPGELHLTLAYLGKVNEIAPEKLAEAKGYLAAYTKTKPQIAGVINGLGHFFNEEPGAFYASFDSPALPGFRQALVKGLIGIGLPVSQEHGFTPHITLGYLDTGEEAPLEALEPVEVTFEALAFVIGEERILYPLGEGMNQ
jgi:2'-5' RNA ligase